MTSNRPPTLTSQSVNNAAVAYYTSNNLETQHHLYGQEHPQSTPSKCQTPKNKPKRLSKRLRTPKVHTYLHPPLSPRYSSLTRPSDPNHPAHPEHPKVRHRPIPTCLPHQKNNCANTETQHGEWLKNAGKKFGNAAIFGAGATAGRDAIQGAINQA